MENKTFELKNSQEISDKKISIALMASFLVLMIQYFFLVYFNLLNTNIGTNLQIVSKVLVGFFYLYALPYVVKKNLNVIGEVYFIATLVFLLNFLFFPANRSYLVGLIFPFFFVSLPGLIYSLSIVDLEIFRSFMRKASLVVFFVGLILGFFITIGRASIGGYSMSLSYYMLMPTLIFLDELIDKWSLKKLLIVIISLSIILAFGSRGPIFSILIFLILKFVGYSTKGTYKAVLSRVCILSSFLLIAYFYEYLVSSLLNFFLKMGINSRNLILFLRSGIHLSGRESIYKEVILQIKDNPLLGIGIAGDRRILDGIYSHNFFLEIIGNFGILLGVVISVIIVLLIIKSLLIKNADNYKMIIIWINLGFTHLMISGSYFIDIRFWIFWGIIFNILGKNKNYRMKILSN